MTKTLEIILEKASAWPKEAQDELVRAAKQIEEAQSASAYTATNEELKAIDEGLSQMRRGEFASKKEVDAFFKSRKP